MLMLDTNIPLYFILLSFKKIKNKSEIEVN